MSERLYLVNVDDEEYIVMAKGWSAGYELGNVDLLKNFLGNAHDWNDIKLIKERDWPEIYNNFTNVNKDNGWKPA